MTGAKMHKKMCADEPFSVHSAFMDFMVRFNGQTKIIKMENYNPRNRL